MKEIDMSDAFKKLVSWFKDRLRKSSFVLNVHMSPSFGAFILYLKCHSIDLFGLNPSGEN